MIGTIGHVMTKKGRNLSTIAVIFKLENSRREMVVRVKTVQQYIDFLDSKGFTLHDDAIGFIQFGQQYTKASDELTNTAIELTLKAQKK